MAWTWVGKSKTQSRPSHQPLGPCLIYTIIEFSIAKASSSLCLATVLCFDTFSALCWTHSSARVILFDHFLHFAQYQGDAWLPLRPALPRISIRCQSSWERWKEALQPFYSINHDSFYSRSLVSIFIATHPSPCHHICVHPPANYAARFLQMTLIRNYVFSAQADIQSINEG